MTIRTKLVLLLTIPLLALLAVAAVAVRSAVDRAAVADEAVELADEAGGPGDVARALSVERATTLRFVRGLATEAELADVRVLTDQALQQGLTDLAAATEAEQAAYAPAMTAYAQLSDVREGIVDGTVDESTAWDFYSEGIELVLDGNRFTRSQVELADLRTGLDRLALVERAIDADAALRAALDALIEGGVGPSIDDRAVLGSLDAARALRLADADVTSPDLDAVDDALDEVLAAAPGEALAVDTDELAAASRGAEAALLRAAADEEAALLAAADDVRSSARNQQILALIGAGLVVVVALVFAFVGSRSIARPLRRLTDEATSIADERLPAAVAAVRSAPLGEDVELPELPPVVVEEDGEIGQVGGALDRLQHVALDLAVEQAVLRHNVSDSLLNLARRTQNLVGRQLDALIELEQEETDPEALERLFEIDHLATRIRRHAESLIILASTDPARGRGDAASIGDVLRAALGEVEDYQRVEFGPVDDAVLHGHAVTDLAHLLAELLENGLHFSPPDQPVGIVGRRMDEVYRIAIVDCGIGLTAEEMAVANSRLAGDELPTVAPSRYLGLYVTARLAHRLGASVRLSRAATGGVLADVLVPLRLLVDEDRPQPIEEIIADPSPDDLPDAPPSASELLEIPSVPGPLPYAPDAVIGAPVPPPPPAPPLDGDDIDVFPLVLADAGDDAAHSASTDAGGLPRRQRSRPAESATEDQTGDEVVPVERAPGSVEPIASPADVASVTGHIDPVTSERVVADSEDVVESVVVPASADEVRNGRLAAVDGGTNGQADHPTDQVESEHGQTGDAFDQVESEHGQTGDAFDQVESEHGQTGDAFDHVESEHEQTGDAFDHVESEHGQTGDAFDHVESEHGQTGDAFDHVESEYGRTGDAFDHVELGHAMDGNGAAPEDTNGVVVDDVSGNGHDAVPAGLARRVPGANLRDSDGRFDELRLGDDALAERDADSVREMLSRFSDGVQRGRGAASHDEEQSDV